MTTFRNRIGASRQGHLYVEDRTTRLLLGRISATQGFVSIRALDDDGSIPVLRMTLEPRGLRAIAAQANELADLMESTTDKEKQS